MNPKARTCQTCGKPLVRKWYRARMESFTDFNRRKFCDLPCFYKRSSPVGEETRPHSSGKTIGEAVATIESGDAEQRKSAMEFLEDVVNDPSADTITRVNAAKALLPYQAKKAGAKTGKKTEREEAATKAVTGRFSPGPVPRVVNIDRRRDKM